IPSALAGDDDGAGRICQHAQDLGDVRGGGLEHDAVVVTERRDALDEVAQRVARLSHLDVYLQERHMHMRPGRGHVMPRLLVDFALSAQIDPCEVRGALRELLGRRVAGCGGAVEHAAGRGVRTEQRKGPPVRRKEACHVCDYPKVTYMPACARVNLW